MGLPILGRASCHRSKFLDLRQSSHPKGPDTGQRVSEERQKVSSFLKMDLEGRDQSLKEDIWLGRKFSE